MRQHLFQYLLIGNNEYRDYFVKLTSDVLNHLLTQDYFEERCRYYEKLAVKFQTKDPFTPKMREFLLRRADFIRKDLQKQLTLGEIFICRLISPKKITFQVDGYSEKNDYKGWYYDNSIIQIKVDATYQNLFSHWLVNGHRIDDIKLNHIVKEDTEIRVVFKQDLNELERL